MTDPDLFQWEQRRLGGCWTLLGVAQDVARDGDWFRATLGGRSVFVQRFGTEVRAFENVCLHRFYPLRTEAKGNGPVRCGFHHWQYDHEGRAVGIPKCKEMFGVTPREMDVRLAPVEVATCGPLIFGRFTEPGAQPTLEEYLGDGFPILRAMTDVGTLPAPIHLEARANWKLGIQISMDDYHAVAIHPDTFGKYGYLNADAVRYHRFGLHSAFFLGPSGETPRDMAAACAARTYRPRQYRILNLFPNLLTSHTEAAGWWFNVIQQYVPVAPDRTEVRSWIFPSSFPARDQSLIGRVGRGVTKPFLPVAVPPRLRKIVGEDNRACEQLQIVAGQVDGDARLGRLEERIGWFLAAYAECLGPEPATNTSSGEKARPS